MQAILGGGNNLNIIRLPSLNEVKNIISSDLNGSIKPYDNNVWYWDRNLYWAQNNEKNNAYVSSVDLTQPDPVIKQNLFTKDLTYYPNWQKVFEFIPIIEYRE